MKYFLLIIILIIFILINSFYSKYFSYTEKFQYNTNFFNLNDDSNWGFIILRHVSNPNHNKLWIENYSSIRKLYKNKKIIIIDDNNNYNIIVIAYIIFFCNL